MNASKSQLVVYALITLNIIFIVFNMIEVRSNLSALTSLITSEADVSLSPTDEGFTQIEHQRELNLYRAHHRETVDGAVPKRMFVYIIENSNGLGNRMNSYITGFLVSMLKKTAVIIAWKDIEKYIEEPLTDAFYKIKNMSNETEMSYLYKPEQVFYFPKLTNNSFRLDKNLSQMYSSLPENYDRFVFEGYCGMFFELAMNVSYYKSFRAYGLAKESTLSKASRLLKDKERLNSSNLNDLYQVGFEIGHNILRHFWQPNKNIKKQMNPLLVNYFNNPTRKYFIIGLQMRFEYLDREDLKLFYDCAFRIEIGKNLTSSVEVKWYVSTDNESELNKIKQAYPNKVIHGEGEIGSITGNIKALPRAILDVEMLSKCDELIITGGSTFGFLASLRNGHKFPYFVNGYSEMTECEQFQFTNPSHTPYQAAPF